MSDDTSLLPCPFSGCSCHVATPFLLVLDKLTAADAASVVLPPAPRRVVVQVAPDLTWTPAGVAVLSYRLAGRHLDLHLSTGLLDAVLDAVLVVLDWRVAA